MQLPVPAPSIFPIHVPISLAVGIGIALCVIGLILFMWDVLTPPRVWFVILHPDNSFTTFDCEPLSVDPGCRLFRCHRFGIEVKTNTGWLSIIRLG